MKNKLNVQIRNFNNGSIFNNHVTFDIFDRIVTDKVESVGNSMRFRISNKNKYIYINVEDWQRFLQWKRDKVLEQLV